MKKRRLIFSAILSFFVVGCNRQTQITSPSFSTTPHPQETLALPAPHLTGTYSLEETLQKRRSDRTFSEQPLSIEQVSQLLWAGQGITNPDTGGRTAPSAGALYPIELFLVVLRGTEPEPGIYHYNPNNHQLLALNPGNFRDEVYELAFEQGTAHQAPAVLFISVNPQLLEEKYGNRAESYALIEAGHVAQNILLQATAMDLHIVSIGAISTSIGRQMFQLGDQEIPLYLLPVGYPPTDE